jgi:hypothetical protein
MKVPLSAQLNKHQTQRVFINPLMPHDYYMYQLL